MDRNTPSLILMFKSLIDLYEYLFFEDVVVDNEPTCVEMPTYINRTVTEKVVDRCNVQIDRLDTH